MSSDRELEFFQKDREIGGEMSIKATKTKGQNEDGTLWIEFGYDEFSIRKTVEAPGKPCISYEVKAQNGESIDIVQDLPPGVELYSTPTYKGVYRDAKRKVDAPDPVQKGRFVSTLHEIQHAKQHVDLDKRQKAELRQARNALEKREATEEQASLVLQFEEEAWGLVDEEIERIEEALGIKVVKDRDSYDAYKERRLDNYREHITS